MSKRSLFIATGLASIIFFLVACGTNANTTTTGSSTNPTATSASASPVATHTPPPVQHCGIVQSMRMLVVPTDEGSAKNVEGCFWQAYQHCNPATMIYSQGSIDTVTIHAFSLKNLNGTCVITDALQHEIAPHLPKSAGNHVCNGLKQQADGLHFLACTGEGDVLVPA